MKTNPKSSTAASVFFFLFQLLSDSKTGILRENVTPASHTVIFFLILFDKNEHIFLPFPLTIASDVEPLHLYQEVISFAVFPLVLNSRVLMNVMLAMGDNISLSFFVERSIYKALKCKIQPRVSHAPHKTRQVKIKLQLHDCNGHLLLLDSHNEPATLFP